MQKGNRQDFRSEKHEKHKNEWNRTIDSESPIRIAAYQRLAARFSIRNRRFGPTKGLILSRILSGTFLVGGCINNVQTSCIVKGEAQKSPPAIFWGLLIFSQEHLFSRNSTREPLNLIKSPIFTNTPCKSTCLYNAPSLHTVDCNRPRNRKRTNRDKSKKRETRKKDLYRANGRGGKLLTAPPRPPETLCKADCGYCGNISRNAHPCKHFRALSIPALQREAAWAEERPLGDLRQSVPKNSRPFPQRSIRSQEGGGGSRGGRCANLSQIARQICAKLLIFRFVHHTKGARICRKLANPQVNFGQFYANANTPFAMPLFLKLLIYAFLTRTKGQIWTAEAICSSSWHFRSADMPP